MNHISQRLSDQIESHRLRIGASVMQLSSLDIDHHSSEIRVGWAMEGGLSFVQFSAWWYVPNLSRILDQPMPLGNQVADVSSWFVSYILEDNDVVAYNQLLRRVASGVSYGYHYLPFLLRLRADIENWTPTSNRSLHGENLYHVDFPLPTSRSIQFDTGVMNGGYDREYRDYVSARAEIERQQGHRRRQGAQTVPAPGLFAETRNIPAHGDRHTTTYSESGEELPAEEIKARKLLLSFLDQEQQSLLKRNNFFFTRGHLSGVEYKIKYGWSSNVVAMIPTKKGTVSIFVCTVPDKKIPYSDHMLAQYLMLQTNEALFVTNCIWQHGGGSKALWKEHVERVMDTYHGRGGYKKEKETPPNVVNLAREIVGRWVGPEGDDD